MLQDAYKVNAKRGNCDNVTHNFI